MKEIIHKSALPIYLSAAVWVLYCIIMPVYKLWHFAILIIITVLAYELFSRFFPGKKEVIEIPPEPIMTGDEKIDALRAEGDVAIKQMTELRGRIKDKSVSDKVSRIIELTRKIFDDLLEDKNDYKQVKRFSDFFLPTTIKLLHEYDRMGEVGAIGENTAGTMQRIENVLDTTIKAYEKQLDALFADQALDIETDIDVLKALLQKEGLSGSDF